MSKKLLFAIIATICATTAFADTKTVTTQDYVDTADALKQDKITAGTTGNVVIYNGTVNGQAQFSERGMFNADDDAEWEPLPNNSNNFYSMDVSEGHADDLISAEVLADFINPIWYEFDNMYGNADTIVVRGNDGMPSESRGIYDGTNGYDSSTDADKLVTAAALQSATNLPTGTAGNVVTYNASGQIGGSVATYNGSTTYNASTDASKIAVMSAVQRKMTCAQYVENAAQTAENCLLWNVVQ